MAATKTIEVITKDCTALSDAEMGDMADLSALGEGWEVGRISKAAEEWVLVSQAYDDGVLVGFVLSTLERIGGTPSLIIGMASVRRVRSRASVLRALMHDQFHKARMAFPDEDVVVSTMVAEVGPFEALADLDDVRPWPDVKPNGEERAWGRRLAKRYGLDDFNDRTMVATGVTDRVVFDHTTLKTINVGDAVAPCVEPSTVVVAWGWAMAEHLDGFLEPAS